MKEDEMYNGGTREEFLMAREKLMAERLKEMEDPPKFTSLRRFGLLFERAKKKLGLKHK